MSEATKGVAPPGGSASGDALGAAASAEALDEDPASFGTGVGPRVSELSPGVAGEGSRAESVTSAGRWACVRAAMEPAAESRLRDITWAAAARSAGGVLRGEIWAESVVRAAMVLEGPSLPGAQVMRNGSAGSRSLTA